MLTIFFVLHLCTRIFEKQFWFLKHRDIQWQASVIPPWLIQIQSLKPSDVLFICHEAPISPLAWPYHLHDPWLSTSFRTPNNVYTGDTQFAFWNSGLARAKRWCRNLIMQHISELVTASFQLHSCFLNSVNRTRNLRCQQGAALAKQPTWSLWKQIFNQSRLDRIDDSKRQGKAQENKRTGWGW